MDKRHVVLYLMAAGLLVGVAACDERSRSAAGATQTGFPGQITAGGGTSGEVMARTAQTAQAKDGSYAGGTPGIAGGSGGNTGGAATGGSVQESGQGPSEGVVPGAQTGGTPGIPAGKGGNTGGAATSGSIPGAGEAPPQGAGSPSTSSQASTSTGSASGATSTTRP